MGNPVCERRSVHKLHDHERLAVVLTKFVKNADARMVQGGQEPRFATDPPYPLTTGDDGRTKYLDRDDPSEPRILTFIHIAHSTAADARKHAVRANIGSHERWLRVLTDQLRRRYISQQVTGFQCFGKERLNLAKQHVVTTAYRGHERCAFVWLAGKCGGVDFLDTSSESGVHHQNLHAADIGLGRFYALPD